jgi:hypothetical protein
VFEEGFGMLREIKSQNQNPGIRASRIDEFWHWFCEVAAALETNVVPPPLLKELDTRVRNLDPELSWEIGPGLSKPCQLVISPNLSRDLREKARKIVTRAPILPAWEFYAARQRKEWQYQLELGDGRLTIDASGWTFVLLRYPGGDHEVLLKGRDLPPLSGDERRQAAAVALESILGEDLILDRVNQFELVDSLEPRFAEKERPIQSLREALAG